MRESAGQRTTTNSSALRRLSSSSPRPYNARRRFPDGTKSKRSVGRSVDVTKKGRSERRAHQENGEGGGRGGANSG